MTTESVLFALLRKEICGETVSQNIIDQISAQMLEELYSLSHLHDLSHLVGHALSELGVLGQNETSKKFQEAFVNAVSRYVRMTHELYSVCSTLEAAGIPHMPLKGSLIRNWYPEPWMRTCTDIDVLVKKQDVEKAAEILCEKMSYMQNKVATCDISLFTPIGVHLELHFDLIEDAVSQIQGQILGRIWDVAEPVKGFSYQYKMPDEWFRFYHIAHMAKHVTSGGCGIRPFLDLWIMDRKVMQDWQNQTALLAEGKLTAFARVAKELSEHWFSQTAVNEPGQMLADFVLSGGKHGKDKNKLMVKQVRRGGRLQYALYRIFKPYSSLKQMYPILEKHRWLMPFCQIHRWLGIIFDKEKAAISIHEMKMNASATEEETNFVSQMLEKLEL